MGRIPTTVGLARGEGLVARFGEVVIFLAGESSSTERILGAAETAAASDDPGVAIAQRLAATVFSSGSAQPPAFGVVAPTQGGILILLRGPVRALAEGPEGAHRLSGERAMTWTDEILRDPVRRITVTADGDKAIAHTDLRAGVVPAGGFVLLSPVSGLAAQARSGSGAIPKAGASAESGPIPRSGAAARSGGEARQSPSGPIVKPVGSDAYPAPDTTQRAPIPTPSRTRFNVPGSPSEPIDRSSSTGSEPISRGKGSSSDAVSRGSAGSSEAVSHGSGQNTTADLSDVSPAFAQTVGVFPDFPGGAAPSGPQGTVGTSREDATKPAPQNGTAAERGQAEPSASPYAGPTTPAMGATRSPGRERSTGGANLSKSGSSPEYATTQRRTPADPASGAMHQPVGDAEPEIAVTQRDNRPDPDEQPATAAFDARRAAAETDEPEPKASRESGPIGAGGRPISSGRNPLAGAPETSALSAIGSLTSSDGAVYPLDRPYVIGRDPMIDESVRRAAASPIVIPRDRHVSRVHAHISIEGSAIFIRDAGTPGGTFVAAPGAQDWIRVGQRPVELKPGWSLRIGGRVLTYRVEQPRI
ncbi:FHA domain-containing protein [Nocardia huaxiensis]|uniref:FHA domain-containing protein n=1 Tax=Nocardia huaxiensis TaxID=2755382 RepID=UPI001E55BCE4|nr:FHA domain-containing protein [Nocardia huaxiensis]UFS96132.1 FHA domain-containing protein [Nocardia huaxiensis]